MTADNSSLPRLKGGNHLGLLPKYQQLLGVPQCFDIKFSRPSVSLHVRLRLRRNSSLRH